MPVYQYHQNQSDVILEKKGASLTNSQHTAASTGLNMITILICYRCLLVPRGGTNSVTSSVNEFISEVLVSGPKMLIRTAVVVLSALLKQNIWWVFTAGSPYPWVIGISMLTLFIYRYRLCGPEASQDGHICWYFLHETPS